MTIPFDQLFGSSSDSTAKEEGGLPMDQLFGGPSIASTADHLIQSVRDAAAVAPPSVVSPYDDSVFSLRSAPPKKPIPTNIVPIQQPADASRVAKPGYDTGTGLTGPDDSIIQKRVRESLAFRMSPQGIKEAMDSQQWSIGETPTGFAKIRQNIASMRLFTDRSLIEFDVGNSSGFHVGTPVAHPVETAKSLIVGIPKFFADLVTKPAALAINKMVMGTPNEFLLPEEREQYTKETIANYAGLIFGAAAGNVSRSIRSGRDILRAGVEAQTKAGIPVSIAEANALAQTLPKALRVENSIPGKIITGIHEGVVGGATTGFILGGTPEERRNLAATYALMALPAGIMFEAGLSIIRPNKLGPNAAAAMQARDLALLGQLQASERRTLQQNTESFYQLATQTDLASAASRASRELGGIVIPAVENPARMARGDVIPLQHQRPDGLFDLAFGIPDLGPGKIEVRPNVASPVYRGVGEGSRPDTETPLFFAVDKTVAEHYAGTRGGEVHAYDVNLKNPADADAVISTASEVLGISPEIIRAQGDALKSALYKIDSGLDFTDIPDLLQIESVRKELQNKGYDGFEGTDAIEDRHPQIKVAFDASQVRRAISSAAPTVQVMKRVHDLGFNKILEAEAEARGAPTAINIEHAARTILHDFETLIDEGVSHEAARKTMLLQHEIQIARPTKAQSTAMFELSGFFPQQHVSYLGKDFIYGRPVIDKKGKLEGHVIRTSGGIERTVPWNELRRGPDVIISAFEADRSTVGRSLANDFLKSMKRQAPEGEVVPVKPFAELVQQYAAERHIPQYEIAPLTQFLGDRLAERMRSDGLSPDEYSAFGRMVNESKRYPTELAADLTNTATSNGMYIRNTSGAIFVHDAATDAQLAHFLSPEEAKQFINTAGQQRGADLTPGGPVPPDGINRGLMAVPPPPNGPHTQPFNYLKDGPLSQLNHWFNTTLLGTRLTGMQQIMKSLDAQLGTEFYARVGDPLQVAFKKKFAAMHADMSRASATAKMARGLTPDQMQQIMTSITTMHPDDMVKAGGLLNRSFTDQELKTAEWFVRHQINSKKVFEYRQGEAKIRRKFADQPIRIDEAIKRLQIKLNVDEAHVEAAKIIREFQTLNKPDQVSVEAIARLSDALMEGHERPDVYMDKSGFTPQMRALRDEIVSHTKALKASVATPDQQRLGGHLAQLRNTKEDAIFVGPEGTPVLTSELLRSGELSEYDRDPINFLVRQINLGFNNRFTKTAVNEAKRYVEQATKTLPVGKRYVKDLLTNYYINELRGIPQESSSFAQSMFDGVLDRLGVKNTVDVRRDLVNTFLSLSSSAAIGFRPMQGIRDFHNFTSIYYTRFGAVRTGEMLTMMHRVTPQELVQAGILKETQPGETVPEAFTREGLSSTYGPISVLTPQERLANTISARTQPVREGIQETAELGIKWGLQHNVYQWAHAASMLESSTRAMRELNKLAEGQYGVGVEAKAKAYKNLFINSYDLPVVKEFDRMVTDGDFRGASDFLARATAFETVSTFGLANHPAGWGTSTGRLFGQFGNWPVWARSMLARQMTRGTGTERAGVAARFGLTQGSLALASSALGLNLSSWYLPTAAPIVSAGQHLAAASESFDEDATKEYERAVGTILLGVPGSLLFRGGPAMGIVGAGLAAGTGYERGEDEAVRAIKSLPLLAIPGSFLLRDIAEGFVMSQQGASPLSAWLRAFGVRSNEEPTSLNPAGIERPRVSDLEL